jgi:hypothetical protein
MIQQKSRLWNCRQQWFIVKVKKKNTEFTNVNTNVLGVYAHRKHGVVGKGETIKPRQLALNT